MFAPPRIYLFTAENDETFYPIIGPDIGITPDTPINFKIQSYDPQTNNWTIISASMPTWREGTVVGVSDDKLYVLGGETVTPAQPQHLILNPTVTFSAINEQYTPFGYGTIAPEISIASPENVNYSMGNVSLTFNLNRPASWIGYSLDKETVTVTGNTTITNLPSGLHNVTIYANDTFGNIGKSETISFNIAKQPEPKPFPTAPLAATSAAAVVAVSLIVYFKKRHPKT